MASARQIAANQRNAQLSTGPVTEAGKLISSMNATTHGLTGQSISRTYDQYEAYNAYSESMLPELAPATALELDFARRIIHDSWRLNRAGAMDDNLIHESVRRNHFDPCDDEKSRGIGEALAFRAEAGTINLLSLYEQRLQRALLKNLAALKAMQKERQAEQPTAARQKPVEQPAAAQQKPAAQIPARPVAKTSKPSPQPVEIPAPAPENGFVCSTLPDNPASPPCAAENPPSEVAA